MNLVRCDIFLLSLGSYLREVVDELKTRIRHAEFRGKGEGGLRHSNRVDAIGKRALNATRKCSPQFSDERNFHEAWSPKHREKVPYVTSLVDRGSHVGVSRGSTPHRTDEGSWRGGRYRMKFSKDESPGMTTFSEELVYKDYHFIRYRINGSWIDAQGISIWIGALVATSQPSTRPQPGTRKRHSPCIILLSGYLCNLCTKLRGELLVTSCTGHRRATALS